MRARGVGWLAACLIGLSGLLGVAVAAPAGDGPGGPPEGAPAGPPEGEPGGPPEGPPPGRPEGTPGRPGPGEPQPQTPYPGGTWEPPAATYGVRGTANLSVPMSDGVELTVDVYRPADPLTGEAAEGSFPVLLTQTPYTRPYTGIPGPSGETTSDGPGAYFVQRGYVFVSADVRGTGRSGGNGGFFSPRDAQDGAELVEWAAALEGGNGVVGLHGCSYLGATQLYTAGALKPGTPVKAMIPMCTKSDPYRDTYMVNGIPAPQWEGAGLLGGALLGPTIEAYMVPNYLASQAGGDPAYYGEFWQDRDHMLDAPAIAAAQIPTLLWNGWNDAGDGGFGLLTALQNSHFGRPAYEPLEPGAPVTSRYQLIVGNWRHGGGLDRGIQLQWYETWLRGVDTGLRDTATPIHVQEQVSGTWSNAGAYPFVQEMTAFNLGADGSLTTGAAAEEAQTLLWAQPDVPGATLIYETEPFDQGATLAGPGAVRVHASSSSTDLQLMADLYDVDPDGNAVPISHGGVLGSLHATNADKSWLDDAGRPVRPYLSLEGEDTLTPGEVIQLDIPLRPAMWRLEAGHRLRLRLVGQEETTRCLEKAREITTESIGCRARAEVQSRLLGSIFTIELGESLLNLPLLPAGGMPQARAGTTPTTPDSASSLPLDW